MKLLHSGEGNIIFAEGLFTEEGTNWKRNLKDDKRRNRVKPKKGLPYQLQAQNE